jgi:outer membrane protein
MGIHSIKTRAWKSIVRATMLTAATSFAAAAADLSVTDAQAPDLSLKDAPISSFSPWFVRAGGAYLGFDSSAKLYLGGSSSAVPGASATAADNATFVFDVGYYLTKDISVMFTGGYPPKTSLTANGTAAALGIAGHVTYGPAALTAQYHFDLGPIKPYAGGGVAYSIIFGTNDGAIQHLQVDGSFAPVVQGGFEFPVTDRVSFFADVKKLWLSVDAKGDVPAFGFAPIKADVTLDPVIVSAGIVYRF